MKILIATCGSKYSDEAVLTGTKLAGATGSSITVLNVFKDPQRRSDAQKIVGRAVELARQSIAYDANMLSGLRFDTRTRLGHPSEEIVSEAIEGNYDLIVIGTWPKKNLVHALLAPTTERIVMQAPCPVVVAKGKMKLLQRVLLCVSGAESPSRPARFLTGLTAKMNNELDVTILHVMSQISANPVVRDSWQLQASAENLIREGTPEGQWLRKDIETLKGTGVRIEPKVRHGLVVEEVLLELQNGNYDMVAIGAHRKAGWQRLLLDDLTHQIVVRADRPVLVV